jgi:hypothetical protein
VIHDEMMPPVVEDTSVFTPHRGCSTSVIERASDSAKGAMSYQRGATPHESRHRGALKAQFIRLRPRFQR